METTVVLLAEGIPRQSVPGRQEVLKQVDMKPRLCEQIEDLLRSGIIIIGCAQAVLKDHGRSVARQQCKCAAQRT